MRAFRDASCIVLINTIRAHAYRSVKKKKKFNSLRIDIEFFRIAQFFFFFLKKIKGQNFVAKNPVTFETGVEHIEEII